MIQALTLLWLLVVTTALSFSVTVQLIDRGSFPQAVHVTEVAKTQERAVSTVDKLEPLPPIPDRNPHREEDILK